MVTSALFGKLCAILRPCIGYGRNSSLVPLGEFLELSGLKSFSHEPHSALFGPSGQHGITCLETESLPVMPRCSRVQKSIIVTVPESKESSSNQAISRPGDQPVLKNPANIDTEAMYFSLELINAMLSLLGDPSHRRIEATGCLPRWKVTRRHIEKTVFASPGRERNNSRGICVLNSFTDARCGNNTLI